MWYVLLRHIVRKYATLVALARQFPTALQRKTVGCRVLTPTEN